MFQNHDQRRKENVMGTRLFMLWFGLTVGNFLYQVLKEEKKFGEAIEHSFFQGVALGLAYLMV